jgi:transposase
MNILEFWMAHNLYSITAATTQTNMPSTCAVTVTATVCIPYCSALGSTLRLLEILVPKGNFLWTLHLRAELQLHAVRAVHFQAGR